jgi:hypothetical protein
MTIIELLERKLDIDKKELDKRKEYFLFSVQKEIDTSCFERNAMSELAAMLECKTRIKALEETIAILKMKG